MQENLRRLLESRRRERENVVAQTRRYAEELRKKLGRVTVILYGSYVRGDFNLWSDVDVLVISEAFEKMRPLKRYDLIMDITPPGFEPKLLTPKEAMKQLAKPWWRKALEHSIVLVDDYGIAKHFRI